MNICCTDMRIDLHLHTDFSDGTYSPSQLIQLCNEKNLHILSITDHDTVEGIEPGIFEVKKRNLKLVPGIELSAKYDRGTLHILGYGIDYRDLSLLSALKHFQDIRKNRNAKMLEKLRSLGIDISMSEVATQKPKSGTLGRPHIAAVLIKKGVVGTMQEAFDGYLGKAGKAYVSKEVLTAAESIRLIHDVGGIAILAHPTTLNLEYHALRLFIQQLIFEGLDGIEVYSSAHSVQEIDNYQRIAAEKCLMVSAGSDFHGANKRDVKLGISNATEVANASMVSRELIEMAIG